MDTRVSGQGFSYPDGTAVTAVFGANASQSAAKQLQGGVFELSFFQSGSCSLGTSRYVPAALYIDADGDGACRLAADEVFVWLASGGPAGNISLALFSPDGAHCPAWVPASLAADVVATVRQLCPEIGECLPFCGLPNPSVPGSGENTAGCASGDAGVEDGGAPDSGGGSSGDAAVRDAAL